MTCLELWQIIDGAPSAIRTHGLPLRRGTLYPAELPGQMGLRVYFSRDEGGGEKMSVSLDSFLNVFGMR